MHIKQSVKWIACLLMSLTNVPAAEVALRVYHPHEVENLIEADPKDYPVTFEHADALQYCIRLHDESLAPKVRDSLKTNKITEEWIIMGELDEWAKQNHVELINRVAMAERNGFHWGDWILYREPTFDFTHPKQDLRPGPWNDARILSVNDIKNLRARLKAAYDAGQLQEENYQLCQLIYCWKNVGSAEKEFLKENFDGVYVELNTRGGNWVIDGRPGEVTQENYDLGTHYKIADFGDPGMTDCAEMARWCLENDLTFGITFGANVRDIWFKDMFDALVIAMEKQGVDPSDPRITYLLHHNRQFDDDEMPYFPESEEDSITNLAKYMIETVGQSAGSAEGHAEK